jgi:hypothetical protein
VLQSFPGEVVVLPRGPAEGTTHTVHCKTTRQPSFWVFTKLMYSSSNLASVVWQSLVKSATWASWHDQVAFCDGFSECGLLISSRLLGLFFRVRQILRSCTPDRSFLQPSCPGANHQQRFLNPFGARETRTRSYFPPIFQPSLPSIQDTVPDGLFPDTPPVLLAFVPRTDVRDLRTSLLSMKE